MTDYNQSTVSTTNFVPFESDGKKLGEVHWLRQGGSGEAMLLAGLWKCEPLTFEWNFPGDETFQVLEGELTISFESGEEVKLKAGDLASFPKGAKSTWTISSPFKKFFVISG